MTLAINYIELENFKSYFGKSILGPFHRNFNAVIGPNGSGKSNLIDALLFVFGFRGQKIRSKTVSVLIHNSEKRQNLNSCSVSVSFHKIIENGNDERDNKFQIVPHSDFCVKRIAYKDNSSAYYIDDHKCKFEAVGALFRECGIDLDHNRFLILQGEVESISLLKPKAINSNDEGLLEYLEDIIGTLHYRSELEKIYDDLERVNQNRTEVMTRVENLRKDKNNLEGPKETALNYLKLENSLIRKKNLYYQARISEIAKQLAERKGEYDEIKQQLKEANFKLDDFVKENRHLINLCAEKNNEFEIKSKLCENLKKMLEDFEQEEIRLNEELKHAKKLIEKLEKSINSETQKIDTLKEIPEKNEREIVQKNEELKRLKTQLELINKLLNEKMDEVDNETKKYHVDKKYLQAELDKLQAIAMEAKSNMEVAQSELDVYFGNQTYEEKKLDETKEKLNDLTKSLENRIENIRHFEKEIPRIENEEYNVKNQAFIKLLEDEKNLIEKISREKNRYTEAQTIFSSSRNRKGVLCFLQQLKSQGKLNGLHGRLGDLGAIDEKYDVAVSTACGALDCIVVDNIDMAQKCVELLKSNNVGSATFIVLDKQEKWRENISKQMNTPENVPRLIDLIKTNNPAFLTAFYYSLRDTLVANDLEQGSRIAYGRIRHRVVTLQGNIIETSGTMSGGGNPQRGRMGNTQPIVNETSHTAESLKRMTDKIKECENELRPLIGRRSELEQIVCELKTKIDEAKRNYNKWLMEEISFKQQIENLKEVERNCLKRLSELTPDPHKEAKLNKNLNDLREKFEKADQLAAIHRNKNDDLRNKIVNITKNILDEPKAKKKEIEDKINEFNSCLTTLRVEIKTSQRNLSNSEKKLADLTEDTENNKTLVINNQKRIYEMDKERKEVFEKHNEVKEECKELKFEIKKMTLVMREIETKKQKFESDKVDLTHRLEKARSDFQYLEDQNKRYSSLLKSLRLHDIDSLSCLEAIQANINAINESSYFPNLELKKIDEKVFEGLNLANLKREIQHIEENLKSQSPNLQALQKYRALQIKFMERVNELNSVTSERDNLYNLIENLRNKRLTEFMIGFTRIRLKLKEIYRTITFEGDAELELVDSLDPFQEGIVLSVRPPKKSWKNVCNLSGGEKTLSSLSLVFALHEFKTTPIYVMDEIDAALDFKNVSIIANYIKERTKNAQFIVVSLRNNMFELCDRLFGIYKVNNCTGSTYIAPELIELDEKKKKTIVINTTDQLGRKSESNQNVKPSSSSLSTLPKIVEAIEEDLSCVQMNTN